MACVTELISTASLPFFSSLFDVCSKNYINDEIYNYIRVETMAVNINKKIVAIFIILMMVCVVIAAVSLAKNSYSKGDPDDVDDPGSTNRIEFRVNHFSLSQGEGGDPDEFFI